MIGAACPDCAEDCIPWVTDGRPCRAPAGHLLKGPKPTGASFARGSSKQDYATPRPFLKAVERRFGRITFDLAASADNAVVPDYFGPDRPEPSMRNALSPDCLWWRQHKLEGHLWLNPPFDTIGPWAAKCAASMGHKFGCSILFLVPASVGSEWYATHVHGKALVLLLRPRLSFDGKNPYPKDCLLAVYGERPGVECWKWTE